MSDRTRCDEMREYVIDFHESHPEVWRLFCRFTLEKINQGFSHYSARGVFHRIRWETGVPEERGENEFKLNDHHSPFYARAFMLKNPQHDGFFRLRKQISEETSPSALPPLGPRDYQEIKLGLNGER
jgi:hypothetical protein